MTPSAPMTTACLRSPMSRYHGTPPVAHDRPAASDARLGCKLCALRERLELGPGYLRMGAAAEAAVRAGDHVLRSDPLGKSPDALRHQFGMLDAVGCMLDQAGYQDLAGRQLHMLPHGVLVLMPRIGSLDQIPLRAH